MGLEPLTLTLYYGEVNLALVESAISHCLEQGCTTRQEGESDDYWYLGAHSNYDGIFIDRTTAEQYLADRGGGILFWYDDFDFMLWAYPQQYQNRPPCLSLNIDVTHLKPRSSKDTAERRVLQLTELVGGLIEKTHPAVGYGAISDHIEDEAGLIGEIPAETVLNAHADLVHWFTYLPLLCVERIGRERIRGAPAWHVAELDTGGAMLVASGQPLFGGETERQQVAEWLDFSGSEDRAE